MDTVLKAIIIGVVRVIIDTLEENYFHNSIISTYIILVMNAIMCVL